MAIKTIDDTNLTAIADAIRGKGVTGTFTPSQMAAAIQTIQAGGGEDLSKYKYLCRQNTSAYSHKYLKTPYSIPTNKIRFMLFQDYNDYVYVYDPSRFMEWWSVDSTYDAIPLLVLGPYGETNNSYPGVSFMTKDGEAIRYQWDTSYPMYWWLGYRNKHTYDEDPYNCGQMNIYYAKTQPSGTTWTKTLTDKTIEDRNSAWFMAYEE